MAAGMDLGYLKTYNEEALREIVYQESDQYEPLTVETAKAELKARYASLLSTEDGGQLLFHHLLQAVTFDDVRPYLTQFTSNKNAAAMATVFARLQNLEPDEHRAVALERVDRRRMKTGHPAPFAIGRDMGTGERVDLPFLTWQEWLSVRIPPVLILHKGPEWLIALSLSLMTENGFDETDTVHRLQELETLVETGFAPVEEVKEEEEELDKRTRKRLAEQDMVHPWIRYWARCIDYSLILPLYLILKYTILPQNSVLDYITLSYWLWLPLEVLLLSTWGTTPGKWLLRVTVQSQDGHKPSFRIALFRSFLVLIFGMGGGLLYANTVMLLVCYTLLKQKKRLWYDQQVGFSVTHQPIERWRSVTAIVALIALLIIYVVLLKALKK